MGILRLYDSMYKWTGFFIPLITLFIMGLYINKQEEIYTDKSTVSMQVIIFNINRRP